MKGRRKIKPVLLALLVACVLGFPGSAPLRARQKSPRAYTIQLPPQPDYSALDWLRGDWTGKITGKGPQGEVLLSVAYELGKRFMTLREHVSLPATKQAPATRESMLGILHPDQGGGLEMNLYSSSGFVTRYRVVVRAQEVDFEPEGGSLPPPGWLFRRILSRTSSGECVETVDVAPPQQAFFNYYTADLSRVAPPGSGARKTKAPSP
ncbi:MAG: hypothetical protein ACRD3D_06155 [Terriglobia bacterium]